MKKILYNILFVLLIALPIDSSAQNRTELSGTITDETGAPVPGAVIMLEGHESIGAVSDTDGKYRLVVPENRGMLKVQCLGYSDQTAEIGSGTVYDFMLKDDSQMLQSVVVVGYGTMKESDITGSVTRVRMDENLVDNTISVDKMLKGRAAGVHVVNNSSAPGAGFSIKIRGNSSFNSAGEPLYVVDGVILTPPTGSEPEMMSNAAGNYEEESNGLMGLDPQDIATMEILKDASATAIYGALGANGVVLITTKSASKDKPVIRFSTGFELSKAVRLIDMLDLRGFAEFMQAAGSSTYDKFIYANPDTKTELSDYGINWQEYVTRTAFNKRTSFSVSNRSKGTGYVFSLGYNDVQGVVRQSGMDQIKMRLNLDQDITKWLKAGTKINISRTRSDMLQGASSAGMTSNTSFIRATINGRPYRIPGNTEDEDADEWKEDFGAGADRWLNDNRDNRRELRIIPTAFLEAKILPWLTFNTSAGADYRTKKTTKWRGPYVTTNSYWALSAIGTTQRLNYNLDNMLMFDRSFGKHSFSGTLGTTFIEQDYLYEVTDGWNIKQYIGQYHNINSAPNARLAYVESQSATFSMLARGVYSYKGRYIVTATFRRDGSSRFSKANRYANFPSFAFAWRANEEPWFTFDKIAVLKLRAGWGRVGNQAIASYQTLSNYSSVQYPDHTPSNESTIVRGIVPANLANPNLKWETTEQWNAGLDFKLNRNRLSLSLDVYDKNTYDLLQTVTVPATTGFSTMWINLGTVNNRGIELSAESEIIKTGAFRWSVFGNIAHNKNRIVKIGLPTSGGMAPYFMGETVGNANYCKTPINIFMEGYPMGVFFGLATDGIVQEGETAPGLTENTTMAPGGIKYIDKNGNGYVDTGLEDKQIIGDPNPDFTYGFGSSLKWKNLSLDIQFDGVYGNDIANINLIQETDLSRTQMNVRKEAFYGRWTPGNTNGNYPAIGVYTTAETKFFSDRFVEDGSYLRLSDITFTYSLPFRKGAAVKSADISLSASNLLLFTKYSGYDPEVNSFGSNMMKMGIDYGSYPSARTISLGLKMTF